MKIWMQYAWFVIRQLARAIMWDFGRFLGLPLALDPRDGRPDKAIVPQIFALQIAELAKMMDPEFRPLEGNRAGLKIIFRPYFARFQLWRTKRRLSKMAGLKFKTNQSATAFLNFLASELEREEKSKQN